MSKIFEVVTPKSLSNSAYADYEFLLRWVGRDGSDYQYMFYDAEIDNRIDTDPINTESTTNIQSLISRNGRKITLTANDLSRSDLLIIGQIMETPKIQRMKIDGTVEYYAPESNSFKYRMIGGRYDIEFTLIMSDVKTWK
jgi:hypothetical protein